MRTITAYSDVPEALGTAGKLQSEGVVAPVKPLLSLAANFMQFMFLTKLADWKIPSSPAISSHTKQFISELEEQTLRTAFAVI
jgi:hypothetical protein